MPYPVGIDEFPYAPLGSINALARMRYVTNGFTAELTSGTATGFAVSLSVLAGTVGSPVTLSIAPNGPLPSGATLTFSDGSGGGSFSPTFLLFLSGSSAPQTVQYTPATVGTKTLTVSSSNLALTLLPSSLAYTSQSVGAPGTPTSPMPPLSTPLMGLWAGGLSALTLKAGDYGNWLHIDIADANGLVNLTGSVVTLRLRGLYDSVPHVAAAAGLETVGHGETPSGVEYRLVQGDTDTPGDYLAEVAIQWTDGAARTGNLLLLSIEADVG